MDENKVVSGTTSIYASHEIKEPFEQANDYPIAWEIIFRNDDEGKAFANDLVKAFGTLPDEKGFILDTESPINEPIRCVECVFKDKDSFRKILNQTFAERNFINEDKGEIVPKIKLMNDADKLIKRFAAIAC